MKPVLEIVKDYLGHDVDAHSFVIGYLLYCHAIDDLIDGDKTDHEHILKTFEFAAALFTSPFYLKHWPTLYPIIKSNTNSYADSVAFERDKQPWNKAYADVLRQQGNEMIVIVVELVCGYEARREISKKLREISYKNHHNELGEPV